MTKRQDRPHGSQDCGDFLIEWAYDERLKPCPFCGAPARLEKFIYASKTDPEFSVGCGASYRTCAIEPYLHSMESEDEAIRQWNTRGRDNGHWKYLPTTHNYCWQCD